jgi:hypothetical protein
MEEVEGSNPLIAHDQHFDARIPPRTLFDSALSELPDAAPPFPAASVLAVEPGIS